jgi:circadian clock protein KaiC
MNRIKSGVYGLNDLMDGGIIENSAMVVIGKAGVGKTTFALQYIMRGMDVGDDGVFITLDENQEQILREAREMGFTNIDEYIEQGKLVFIDASAEQFSSFIRKELPSFVDEWGGTKSRIVIDPLTPVIWATPDKYMQREIVSFLFKELRKVGTVVSTLEEHGSGDLSGPETIIPMYMADSVVHLQYTKVEDKMTRKLRVVKCRSSRHSERDHDYKIMSGIGITLQHRTPHIEPKRELTEKIVKNFKETVKKLPRNTRGRLLKGFRRLQDSDFETIDPDILINDIIEEYK